MDAFHFIVGNRAAVNYEAMRPKNLRPLSLDRCFLGGRYCFSMDSEHFQNLTLEERIFKLSLEKCIKNNPYLMERLVEQIAQIEAGRSSVGAQNQIGKGRAIPAPQAGPSDSTMMGTMQQAVGNHNPPYALGTGALDPTMMDITAQQHGFGTVTIEGSNQAIPVLYDAPSRGVNMMDPMVQPQFSTPPRSRSISSKSDAATNSANRKHKRASPSSAGPSSTNKKRRTFKATKSPTSLAKCVLATPAMPEDAPGPSTAHIPAPAYAQETEPAVAMTTSSKEQQGSTMVDPIHFDDALATALTSYLYPEIEMAPTDAADPVDFLDEFINWGQIIVDSSIP